MMDGTIGKDFLCAVHAAQPNLHCGRELLPTHVDHPKKDGMEVSQGQAYMLSGMARDACAHGVVASSGHRESLNLRFGLHDLEKGVNHPWISSSNVLHYWEKENILDQGKDTPPHA